jgi:ribonucleoside-diphosphate reductase alpha chain
MKSIMSRLGEAAETMRLGGGDGFDFSTLRPRNAIIKSLDSFSSGPISFMGMWNAMCETIKSAGHRRGAMMACLRIDHPDIEEFINCKQVEGALTNFNISVLVTDLFMKAVVNDRDFDLVFEGTIYKTVKAKLLWKSIMRSTWQHAEPGILFIDTINNKNNLSYCEVISSTNPCGEQPLPPNGACLLGSFNLTKYISEEWGQGGSGPVVRYFNYKQLIKDIPPIVRMMDNVIDRTIYPLPKQEIEAKSKRRMGLGVTGVANAASVLGYSYGSKCMLKWLEGIMTLLRDECYRASIELAKEKGVFPVFNESYFDNENSFVNKNLPEDILKDIYVYGIRNSHLLSIAPTGTISLYAGNISSGIEPVFAYRQNRKAYTPDGTIKEFYIEDYGYANWGIEDKTSSEVTAQEHIAVLNLASSLVDSACSKTANVGDSVTFEEFSKLYMMAYDGGSSGCTTFRPKIFEGDDVRGAVIEEYKEETKDGAACFINEYGERDCAD